MMEKTLVILKPCTLQRGLVGEITNRFERKGLRLAGMKMVQLTDEILNEHYAHLSAKPFFQRVKDSMMACPVIVCCFEGVDAIEAVRTLSHQRQEGCSRYYSWRLQHEFPGEYSACLRFA